MRGIKLEHALSKIELTNNKEGLDYVKLYYEEGLSQV